MKKFLALLMLMLCILPAAHADEDGLTITHSNLFITDDMAYFFARIENATSGSVPTATGKFVLYDKDGNELYTNEYVAPTPVNVNLEPGDYLYFVDSFYIGDLDLPEDFSYELSFDQLSERPSLQKILCEAELVPANASDDSCYVYITATNTTDEMLHDLYFIAGVYDAEGDLIYVDYISLGSRLALHPGSTLTASINIHSHIMKYYQANNITPASVRAMVCYIGE